MNTRIAPSPTGMFHLGTARTAYINYLAARSTGGKFILRIDDTDIERNRKECIDVILESLEWLGLEYDEIHYQSERIKGYKAVAEYLYDLRFAKQLENGAIALCSELFNSRASFHDTIVGEIPVTDTNRDQMNNLILLRGGEKIGQPTYQFASVCDDYLLDITQIIRGVDHITNTPKQIAIWEALSSGGYHKELPKFTHLGLIFKDKKKLSKRDGAASLLWYKKQGYKPEAMLDWMLRLGWSLKVPRGNKELEKIAASPINKKLAIELFQQGNLSNSNCSYDINKLNWLSRKY